MALIKKQLITISLFVSLTVLLSCVDDREKNEQVQEIKNGSPVLTIIDDTEKDAIPVENSTVTTEETEILDNKLPYSEYRTQYSDKEGILYHLYYDIEDLSLFYDNEDIVALGLRYGKYLDLHPLTTMKNLEYLELFSNNRIFDISPLEQIIMLKYLKIVGCDKIFYFAPIRSLINLEYLRLDNDNEYDSDFAFDAVYLSQLTNLEELDLTFIFGRIVNISALRNLTHLKKLKIEGETLPDISWIIALQELEYLALERSQIGDLRPLLDLLKLEFVSLDYSRVNIMPLLESKSIKRIWEPEYEYDESYDKEAIYSYRIAMSNKFWERGISLTNPHDR
jgi:Leucine-rich repeat (LRR) protein